MGKTLFIHAGTEKSGSTSLQDFLLTNGKALEDQGFHFLKSGGVGSTGAMKFTATLCRPKMRLGELPYQSSHVIQRRLIAEIRQSNCPNFIISSEHLHSRIHAVEQINELKSVFLAAGITDIKVIFFIRNQIDLIRSHYSTHIKGDGTQSYRHAFRKLGLSGLVPQSVMVYGNYEHMLDLWSEVFGKENIIVRNYDRTGDVISSFLEILGISGGGSIFTQHTSLRLNTSLDEASLFILANFRDRYPKSSDVYAWLRNALQEVKFKYSTDPMPRSVQIRIWLNFLWSNYRLGRKWPELRGMSRRGFVRASSSWFRQPTDMETNLLDLLALLGKKELQKADTAPTVLLGRQESLGTRGTLYRGCDAGFHKPEEWGCWTREHVAILTANLPGCTDGSIAHMHLRVRLKSFSKEGNSPSLCTIFMNEELVFSGPVSNRFEDIDIDVPLDSVAPGLPNRILFETNRLLSPSETGESADTRKLGLGISHLELNYLSSGKEPASGADRRTAEERTVIQQP